MDNQQKYIKGFNHGYILAEHEPELAKKLVKSGRSDNEYFKGIVSGKQEYEMDKIRHVGKYLPKHYKRDKGKDRDINK